MSSKGFTLIETLVSLVVFLLIALGVTFGLQHAVDGNVYDTQRQDVINTTLSTLNSSTPNSLCPPAGGTTVLSATTFSGLLFTINITCNVVTVYTPAGQTTTSVPATQLLATANWTTFGVSRSVTVQQ